MIIVYDIITILYIQGVIMQIKLSDHFSYKRLLRFVFPSIIMMIFTSVYGVVDGLFVSNFVGKTAFAAVNFIMPLIMMLSAIGFMIGVGGSALISKTLGEGDRERANRYFSLLVYSVIIAGIVISVLGEIFIEPVAFALGARGEMLNNCVLYARISFASLTMFMLQNVFQSIFVTAEKPKIGLGVTLTAGCINIFMDFLLIGVFQFGIAGAAIATVTSETFAGLFPIIYFVRKNRSLLKLGKTKFMGRVLLKACTNGSSELMTNISMSLVNMLYNIQLMKLAGEDGVAAYGVIMYVNFIFIAIFLGYSIGSAPIIGYNYGAQNNNELKNMLKKSLTIISAFAILLTLIAESVSYPLTASFVGYDKGLFELTHNGFMLFSISYLLCGFNIFGSSFFTALGNGGISATISFSRSLLFQIISIIVLPMILGINGIWLSVVAAESMSLIVTTVFLITQRKKYNY